MFSRRRRATTSRTAKTRPSICQCINSTVKLQRCFVSLDSKPSDQTFIPFPTDYLTVQQLSRYLDERA